MSASHQSPKVEASAPSGGETPAAARRESIKPSTLREAYAGTKVFWHAKEKLQIKIIECVPPRGGTHSMILIWSFSFACQNTLVPAYASRRVEGLIDSRLAAAGVSPPLGAEASTLGDWCDADTERPLDSCSRS